MALYCLSKKEKLKSNIEIGKVFASRKGVNTYPIRLLANSSDKNINRVCFSAPKKLLKLAVDRNRIKRQMRESYRLNKHILDDNDRKQNIIVYYYANQKLPYSKIESSIKNSLKKLKR